MHACGAQHLAFSPDELSRLKSYSQEADAFLAEEDGAREAAAGGPSAAVREAAAAAGGEGAWAD